MTMWTAAFYLGLLAIPGSLVWLLVFAGERPRPPGPRCGACSYDLRGLPDSAACPECGSAARQREGGIGTPFASAFGVACGFSGLAILLVSLVVCIAAESEGLLFAAVCVAPPFAIVVAAAATSRKRLSPPSSIGLVVMGCLGIVTADLCAVLPPGVWAADAQSGLLVLALPVVGASGAGWGLLAAVAITEAVRRRVSQSHSRTSPLAQPSPDEALARQEPTSEPSDRPHASPP